MNGSTEVTRAVKVSVLMPVYNTKEKHLREAMESILSQTFRDFEFLVVNDASTDPNVERVVLSYDDERIRYSANTGNMGISDVRNKLIGLARGEYLAVMDHDDISLPDRFQKEVAYLDAHPDVGIVGCQFVEFQDGQRRSAFPSEDMDIRTDFMETCALLHPTCMIRKSILEKTGIRYEGEFSPAEDYALYCRMLPFTKFHNIDEILFHYRWHSDNTSKLQMDKMLNAGAAIQRMVREQHPVLYDTLRNARREVTRAELFGCVPFLKTVREGTISKTYLFSKIPVWKTVRERMRRSYYLFHVLPFCTVKEKNHGKHWMLDA